MGTRKAELLKWVWWRDLGGRTNLQSYLALGLNLNADTSKYRIRLLFVF